MDLLQIVVLAIVQGITEFLPISSSGHLILPGTSRSGVTMTAGLFRGLSREAAARFSFLLAVPVMTAAGLAELAGYADHQGAMDVRAMVLGALISALTGLACIHYFLKWLTRFGLLPYVLYRLVLGIVLFTILL